MSPDASPTSAPPPPSAASLRRHAATLAGGIAVAYLTAILGLQGALSFDRHLLPTLHLGWILIPLALGVLSTGLWLVLHDVLTPVSFAEGVALRVRGAAKALVRLGGTVAGLAIPLWYFGSWQHGLAGLVMGFLSVEMAIRMEEHWRGETRSLSARFPWIRMPVGLIIVAVSVRLAWMAVVPTVPLARALARGERLAAPDAADTRAVPQSTQTPLPVDARSVALPQPLPPVVPPAATIVPLTVRHYLGTAGTYVVTAGVPLVAGQVRAGTVCRVTLAGQEVAAAVAPLAGRWSDGSLLAMRVQFAATLAAAGVVRGALDCVTPPRLAARTFDAAAVLRVPAVYALADAAQWTAAYPHGRLVSRAQLAASPDTAFRAAARRTLAFFDVWAERQRTHVSEPNRLYSKWDRPRAAALAAMMRGGEDPQAVPLLRWAYETAAAAYDDQASVSWARPEYASYYESWSTLYWLSGHEPYRTAAGILAQRWMGPRWMAPKIGEPDPRQLAWRMGSVRSAILVESTGGYDGGEGAGAWGRYGFRRDGDAATWLRTFAGLVAGQQGRDGAWALRPGEDERRLTYMGGLVAREFLAVHALLGIDPTPAVRFADYAATAWVGPGGRPVPAKWYRGVGQGGAYEYGMKDGSPAQDHEEGAHPTSAFTLEAEARLPATDTLRRARARAHFLAWSRRFDLTGTDENPAAYRYGAPDGSVQVYYQMGAGDSQAFNEVFTVLPTILGGLAP